MSPDFQSVAGAVNEVRQKCGRSVAEVWQCVTDVTDGHKTANYILALATRGHTRLMPPTVASQ